MGHGVTETMPDTTEYFVLRVVSRMTMEANDQSTVFLSVTSYFLVMLATWIIQAYKGPSILEFPTNACMKAHSSNNWI